MTYAMCFAQGNSTAVADAKASRTSSARGSLRTLALIFYIITASSGLFAQTLQRLSFSGFEWYVRQTTEPEGPMNNLFGGTGTSVDVLPDGALRLSIAYYEGDWYSAEVWTTKSLGYGTYTFRIRTPLAQLHPDLIFGAFTYSRALGYFHREIDIEFSGWGKNVSDLKGQYVIQPYERLGNLHSFPAEPYGGPSTQQFIWLPDRIEFASWLGYGEKPPAGDPRLIDAWAFSEVKSIPKPNAAVHMNLYLFDGRPPGKKDGLQVVIIDGFEFKAAPK